MKLLRTVLAIAISVSMGLLSGCSNGDASKEASYPSNQADENRDNESDFVPEVTDGSISLDEASFSGPHTYIVKNGRCYKGFTSFALFEDHGHMGLVYEDGSLSKDTYGFDVGNSGDETLLTVDRNNGDGIIYTSSEFCMYPVVDYGYCLGYEPIDFDEVNGIEVNGDYDATAKALAQTGVSLRKNWVTKSQTLQFGRYVKFLHSLTPSSASAGFYKGSQWIDMTLQVNLPYYAYDSLETNNLNYEDALVEKTKDGYFKINLDNVSPGIYMIVDYDPSSWEYLPIEII